MQMQKLLTFFSAKILAYMPFFYDQSFNVTLSNDIMSFEQLGPVLYINKNIQIAYLKYKYRK